MLEKIVRRMADACCEGKFISKEEREVYQYGMELVLLKWAHLITMLAIGFAFGMFLETAVFVVFYSVLRSYAGGYHAKTRTGCYVISWVMMAVVLAIVKFCPRIAAGQASFIGVVLSLPPVLYLSPVGSPNRPLDASEAEHYKKIVRVILALEAAAFLVLWRLQLFQFSLAVCMSLVSVSVMLLLQKAQTTWFTSTSFHNGPVD